MATVIRPVGHEDRLSLVEHLDELRTRLIVCVATFAVAFGFCAWQSHGLLHVLNRPLERSQAARSSSSNGVLSQASTTAVTQRDIDQAVLRLTSTLAQGANLSPAARASFDAQLAGLRAALARLPATATAPREPVTLGVGEPFTQSMTVAAYFALLISLPLLLYQLYAFIVPAFSPRERRVALPLMVMVPFLFVIGVAFCYFVVLPPAINFLQNFNGKSFDILVRASDYYRFEIIMMVAMGAMFQIPVGLLALNRAGIVSARFLRRQWRYAIVLIAILAALLPGTDPVTTVLEMVPLVVLYGLSILLVMWFEHRDHDREAAGWSDGG